MEQFLMLWMGIFWDIALLRLTLRTVRRAGERNENVQFTALTFGMGSALGVVFCALSGLTAQMIAFGVGLHALLCFFCLYSAGKEEGS